MTFLKPRLRISIFQLSPVNRLLRIEQSGAASSIKVPLNLKQRESVKLKGGVKKGKQGPRDHDQTQHSPNSLALFATDSLELKLAFTAINEHTDLMKKYIPTKLLSGKKINKPWINKKIKSLLRCRDKLFRRMKKTKNEKDVRKYKDCKKAVQKQERQSYWTYINNII